MSYSNLPQLFLGKGGFEVAHTAPLHDLHLIGVLTGRLEPTLAYLTLSFLFTAATFAVWSNIRGHLKVGKVIRLLEVNASPPPGSQVALAERAAARHGLEVGLVMSNYPFSFVWGFSRSKLILSSGLLCALTTKELTGVIEHEAAHHLRRDNLTGLLLLICAFCSPAFPLSRLILKWRAQEVEMICDEVAAARTSAPLEIAEALVKVRRQSAAKIKIASLEQTYSGFISDEARDFERRVLRLLDFADSMPDPAKAMALSRLRKGGLTFAALIMLSSLAALSLFDPLAIHHATESLIQIAR